MAFENEALVLILIVMDNGLSRGRRSGGRGRRSGVLILIVMENGLSQEEGRGRLCY